MGLREPSGLADGLGIAVPLQDCVPVADAETAPTELLWLAVDDNEVVKDGDVVCVATKLSVPLSVRDPEAEAVDEVLGVCDPLPERDWEGDAVVVVRPVSEPVPDNDGDVESDCESDGVKESD